MGRDKQVFDRVDRMGYLTNSVRSLWLRNKFSTSFTCYPLHSRPEAKQRDSALSALAEPT